MLNFDTMITPVIVKIFYVITTLIGMLIGLRLMFTSYTAFPSLMGLGIVVASPFITRIGCEGMIVLFKIHENLNKLANKID